jgi:hypothetical protein
MAPLCHYMAKRFVALGDVGISKMTPSRFHGRHFKISLLEASRAIRQRVD